MMKDYYLRFTATDLPAIRSLGILLGELHDTADGSLSGNGFVYIGQLTEPTGEFIVDPDTSEPVSLQRVVSTEAGEPYLHANLRTHIDLRATAESMAVLNPDMAAALSTLDRFFLLDAEGQPRKPSKAKVVFF
jgi:hypothetical protein